MRVTPTESRSCRSSSEVRLHNSHVVAPNTTYQRETCSAVSSIHCSLGLSGGGGVVQSAECRVDVYRIYSGTIFTGGRTRTLFQGQNTRLVVQITPALLRQLNEHQTPCQQRAVDRHDSQDGFVPIGAVSSETALVLPGLLPTAWSRGCTRFLHAWRAPATN